jgi:hypothetical protein
MTNRAGARMMLQEVVMGKYRAEASVVWIRERERRKNLDIPLEFCCPTSQLLDSWEQLSIGEAKDEHQLHQSFWMMEELQCFTIQVKIMYSVLFLQPGWHMGSLTLKAYEGKRLIHTANGSGPTRGESTMWNGIEEITFHLDDPGWSDRMG